jgi:hypothetical protein
MTAKAVIVNGSGGDGVFATAVDAIDGMVVAASTAPAQLTTMTAIAAATIGRRGHCSGYNFVIIPPSHCRLHLGRPPSTKTTIAADAINCCLHKQ